MTAFAIPLTLDDVSRVEGGDGDSGCDVGGDIIL